MDLIVKVKLQKFNWYSQGKIHAAGFAWFGNSYLARESLIDELKKHQDNIIGLKEFLAGLNGQYAILIERNDECWLASSIHWCFPLFYSQQKTGLQISDDPALLVNNNQDDPCEFTANYFTTFGVCPRNRTLDNDIFQIRPGELLQLDAENSTSIPIHFQSAKQIPQPPTLSNPEEVKNVLLESFSRYSKLIADKQVLLPLTAGYDSRLLACLLKEFGHTNVLCATWGRADNQEKETAAKVAQQLGFDYHFVNYSEIVQAGFSGEDDFREYIPFAGHTSSMPFLQDYFGIKWLKENQLIDSSTVVMPGHPGDFISGEHLSKMHLFKSPGELSRHIISRFSTSISLTKAQKLKLSNHITANYTSRPDGQFWKGYEQWDLEERQAKFIGNSTLAFRFFGLEPIMPLFDQTILRFFERLEPHQRINSQLYNKTLETLFFRPQKVDFNLKRQKTNHQLFTSLKNLALKFTPEFVKQHYYPINDPICYREMTNELREMCPDLDFSKPVKPHFYNAFLTQWYLKTLNNR
ncbi:asparagine synthase-related protein [Mangrovibacterium sp.]|uniref:asparagine synthase-related protein n=1 Tax=Mangrovibacterium sp. TaxID=1961364 RepID=UPI0035668351